MSDASSQLAHETEKTEVNSAFMTALADWLETPTDTEALAQLKAAAAAVDDVMSARAGRMSLSSTLDQTCRDLLAKNENAWAKLLSTRDDVDYSLEQRQARQRLRRLSPFSGKVLIRAKYGLGFVSYDGEFDGAIARRITETGGEPFAGQDYLLVLPADVFAEAHVVPLQAKKQIKRHHP